MMFSWAIPERVLMALEVVMLDRLAKSAGKSHVDGGVVLFVSVIVAKEEK